MDAMNDAPVLVLGDLDDTLFQTRRKCPPGCRILPAAYGRTGEALSFTTEKQRRLLDWLMGGAAFVPVTGRNGDALARVDLPFGGYAVTSFGGVIRTPDGGSDDAWREHVSRHAAADGPVLEALHRAARARAAREGVDVRAAVVADEGMPLYLSLKHQRDDAAALAAFAAGAAAELPAGWRVHLNDNNAACLPPWLAKEHAVRHFLEHVAPPDALTLGFGDSHSDAPFLALCDYALVPAGSQLGRHLRTVQAYAHAR
jgi:hydroxymethylpyrimidine pyrophosphatase-like HAD family hydrolase